MNGNPFKKRLLATSVFVSAILALSGTAMAQDAPVEDDAAVQETVRVTGTRIQQPGLVSSSPIATLDMEEFDLNQTVEIERLFRDLPIALPGDNQNVNNGSAGATTLNLRALGAQRTLVLVNGQRMVPYDINGFVDVSAIPVLMLESIDVVTGGASAVYGSDAMAGAVNFKTRDDFAGFEIDAKYSELGEGDGETYTLSTVMGSNLDDGRGNVTLGLTYTDRKGVLLGDRDYSRFGISTANGPAEGGAPPSPEPNCDAPEATTFESGVGSTTAMPTALDLPGGTIQLLNDGSVSPRCSRFNFSPFNYLQTPQERYVAMATGRYEVNDSLELYTRANFAAINVRQQVAPSGFFGNVFEIPLANPFLTDAAVNEIIANVNGELSADFTLADAGVNDINGNGIFDEADTIDVPVRRRTLELGTRSTNFDSNNFQFVLGTRGDLFADWTYDIYYSHAEAERTNVNAGYTNVSNAAIAINTVSADQCETVNGDVTDGCVPLDIFSTGFGSITPEMAAFSSATAIDKREYIQNIVSGSMQGTIPVTLPTASTPIAIAFGTEYREEIGSTTPDECLKEAPTSCLGGAGGNQLPISSSFDVYEAFVESFVPLAQDMPFAEDVALELGFRVADYSSVGSNETWKVGLNWEVVPGFRARVMQQQAVRAPNISELGSPVTTGLDDADFDPCSNGNPAFQDASGTVTDAAIAAELAANPQLETLCVATGVQASRIGLVGDIVSGQINAFSGTDQDNLPDAETAETFTAGFTWQSPEFGNMTGANVTVDYFDIEITDVIGEFSPSEVLDNCYVLGNTAECDKINRIGGSLATAGAGVDLFTTNLDFIRTEGFDIGVDTNWDLDGLGELSVGAVATYLLTQESQSSPTTDVIDCLGFFGNDCQPTPELRFNVRGTWMTGPFTASVQWRYLGEVDIQEGQRDSTFDDFESIDAYNYIDFTGGYDINDTLALTVNVRNVFDEDPPIVGNQAGSTARNFGNTFPSTYETLGRTITVGARASF